MRILIVDDHALFREGLRLLLAQLEPHAELYLAPGAEQAITEAKARDFDLIFLDWNLNGLTQENALTAIHAAAPAARIIILSAEREINLIHRCIDLGASGFIHKDSSPELLISAMKLILGGGVFLPQDAFINLKSAHSVRAIPASKKLSDIFPELTAKHVAVLSALVKGLSNKQIAQTLFVSEETVKAHLKIIYRIMDVQSRTQAIYVLAQHHLNLE